MQPAKIQLERGKHIALLDRNIRNMGEFSGLLAKYEDISRENLFVQFANGMNDVFAGTGFFDTLTPLAVEKITVYEGNAFPAPIPADSVRALCRSFQLDYLVCIELQCYKSIQYKLNNYWLIRLYSSDQGLPMDSLTLCSHVYWPDTNTEEFLGNILTGAWDKGTEYACRIVPYWEQTERRIYNNGKILRLGDVLLKDGKTEEAIKVWTAAINLAPKTAIRAAIDLAWIYENAGDFEKAAEILEKAGKRAVVQNINNEETDYLRKYNQVIRQRMEKRKVLDQQIAPEEVPE